jgi:hypothetical protein
MRSWFAALALLAVMAPAALAGGLRATIEGPGPDGDTYTVRTHSLKPTDTLEPWALAEGRVGKERKTVLLRLRPTGEHGVYTFTRTWPEEGRWMIRLNLGHPPAPATVAALRADGTVESNKHYRNSDGMPQCNKALRLPGEKDDGC